MLYFQRIFCSFACPLKLEEGACKKEKYHINKSSELINLQVWRSSRKGHRWCQWDICIHLAFHRHLHPCKDSPSMARRHRKLPFATPSYICRSGYHLFPYIYHWHKPDFKRFFITNIWRLVCKDKLTRKLVHHKDVLSTYLHIRMCWDEFRIFHACIRVKLSTQYN